MPQFHLSQPRDGGPVACDCEIGHEHDAEALTKTEVRRQLAQLIKDAYLDGRSIADLTAQADALVQRIG